MMATKRAPLANVPNAVNSPFRNVAAAGGKRTRAAQLGDAVYGQPPAKKHVIEIIEDDDEENVDPNKKNGVAAMAHDRLDEPFSKRSNAQPNAFERKLAAVRDRKPLPTPTPTTQHQSFTRESAQKSNRESVDSIRQWQRHYRKQFPNFVIYFESVPDDVRHKTLRQIHALGAREEKFFSKAVTHVVTTRTIPPELATTSPDDDGKLASSAKPAGMTQRTTSLLDANLQRRAQSHGSDILSRARELGIKIWALEKLHRMLKTIEADGPEEPPEEYLRAQIAGTRPVSKPSKGANLEQLLRNEKINGPADRDMTVAAQDMISFRGYYIYVHDMDEKTKPTLVRDYAKPTSKEQGKWPQFRLTAAGRCPFIDDPSYTRKLQQQEYAAHAAANSRAQDDISAHQRRTRAASAQQAAAARPEAPVRASTERQGTLRRSPRKLDTNPELSKPLDPPRGIPNSCQSSFDGTLAAPPLFGSAQQSLRGLPRMFGGEPVASGVQGQNNITSAIRSQYVSSAAISSTAPGASHRVGDSKEVSALKRKVLERGGGMASGVAASRDSIPSSYMNDMRAAINGGDSEPRIAPMRAAKRKAQEALGTVHEDEEGAGRQQQTGRAKAPAAKPKRHADVVKEPKPGYCENCRDKFDDFDDVSSPLRNDDFQPTY